ncbi:MAG: glycoside hydrolase [Chloroflexi bacterium]|nr:glycoside hydrolase [Chloroflexota bacterium]
MLLKKTFEDEEAISEVTFSLPNQVEADSIHVVGSFNDWDESAHAMQRQEDGSWTLDVKLDAGKIYEFRYLINGTDWYNDPDAEGYTPNPHGTENCLLST